MAHTHNGPGPLPTLYFKLTDMRPNPHFEQRYSRDGIWLPPRPLRSNIPRDRNSPELWYRYQAGVTTQVHAPDTRQLQLHHTYSFYSSATKLFIYPHDALRHQVGDGSGNRRLAISPVIESVGLNSSDDSESDVEIRPDLDDWRELAFAWFQRGNAAISHAAFRGRDGTRLRAQWPDHGQIRELLPNRYHADGTTIVPQGQGGMTGEIAILVALVVYSLPPDRLDPALRGGLRANYWPHGLPQGYGCKFDRFTSTCMVTDAGKGLNMRGLVVSVWYERDRHHATSSRSAAAAFTAAQKIGMFEMGVYPGHGKFVV